MKNHLFLLSEGFTLTTGMIITIAIVAVVLLILIIFLAQYKRVAPNEIMVISGGGIQPDPVTGSKTKRILPPIFSANLTMNVTAEITSSATSSPVYLKRE